MVHSTWPQKLTSHSQDQGRRNAAEVLVVFLFWVGALSVCVCVSVYVYVCICGCVRIMGVSVCCSMGVTMCKCDISLYLHQWVYSTTYRYWKYDCGWRFVPACVCLSVFISVFTLKAWNLCGNPWLCIEQSETRPVMNCLGPSALKSHFNFPEPIGVYIPFSSRREQPTSLAPCPESREGTAGPL